MTVKTEVQKLATDAVVTLFQMDLTKLGGSVVCWTNNTDAGESVYFGGVEYTAVPMEWEGFDRDAQNAPARPKMRISNVTNMVTALLQQYKDLIGADLTRMRTFAKYLDSGPEADGNQVFSFDRFKVSRKSAHNKVFVEWELRASTDVEGVMLPKGLVVRYCQARYRRWDAATQSFVYDTTTAACPYTGSQAYDIMDKPTTPDKDRASKRLSCCQMRFGKNAELPFMGFPGVGRLN